jgi:hypothetical protein
MHGGDALVNVAEIDGLKGDRRGHESDIEACTGIVAGGRACRSREPCHTLIKNSSATSKLRLPEGEETYDHV